LLYRQLFGLINARRRPIGKAQINRRIEHPAEYANVLTASLEGTVSGIRENEKRLGDESQQAAYVKREVALQVLLARLAELAQNTDTTPEQESEHIEEPRADPVALCF
jgi:hypothetical protein